MLSALLFSEIVEQAGPSGPPPLSIRVLGKSLITVTFFAVVTFGLAARAVWLASRGAPAYGSRARSTMNSSLLWGGLTLSVALFHTAMGLVMTALSVRAAGAIQPEAHWLIATGVAVPLAASVYGFFVFVLAALIWLGFRRWDAIDERRPGGTMFGAVLPPAFVAGVATAYVWSLIGRPGGPALGLSVVAGLLASIGAASAVPQLLGRSVAGPPSILLSGTGYAVGFGAVLLLPPLGLRWLGGAGFLLILYVTLGLLAGLMATLMRTTRTLATE